ncbi:hypothetical protein BDW69DRAFT_160415 [Aspergillus filifer]
MRGKRNSDTQALRDIVISRVAYDVLDLRSIFFSGFAIMYSLHAVHGICSSQALSRYEWPVVYCGKPFATLTICSSFLIQIAKHWNIVNSHLRFFNALAKATLQIVALQSQMVTSTQKPAAGVGVDHVSYHSAGLPDHGNVGGYGPLATSKPAGTRFPY